MEPLDIAHRIIDANHFMVLGATAAQVPDAELRLYRATVESTEIHVRGSDPEHGTGIGRRLSAGR